MSTTRGEPRQFIARARHLAPQVLLPALSVTMLLGLWEIAPRLGWVRDTSIPPFSEVIAEVVDVLGRPGFGTNVASSAQRWGLGLAIATAIGIPLGTLMGRWRPLYKLVDPLLVVTYPVPKTALILLFVLWWEAGTVSRVGIVITGCLIPIVISSYHGAHAIEERLVWSARGLGIGPIRRGVRVILPAALPQILSGLRLAIAISIFTVLGSELLIRGDGIGAFMFTALDNGQTLTVFAMSTIVATIGFLLDLIYVQAVRRSLPWLEGDI
jgi:NitT/TauT family transport system permease protein